MASLNERFELRLDPELLSRVDAWRAQAPGMPSRAEAVRRLVDKGLSGRPREVRPTPTEKVMLLLMKGMIDALKSSARSTEAKIAIEDASKDANFMLEAISGGHYWAPDWQWEGFLHDEADDPEDVEFVASVMTMWRDIENSYKVLSATQRKTLAEEIGPLYAKNPKFDGFDGNSEGKMHGIATFLVNKLDRFDEFKGRTLNSHTLRANEYQRMLAAYQPLRAGMSSWKPLTVSELASVLKPW